MRYLISRTLQAFAFILVVAGIPLSAVAADRIEGRVEGCGKAIVDADVALWVAGPGAPRRLAETRTGDDGSFDLEVAVDEDGGGVLYLISPRGYIGGLQIITDVDIDPAGNLWVANNWDRPDEGFKEVPDLALSTRFGGNGAVVFFGLAKPVRTPMIGPVQAQ